MQTIHCDNCIDKNILLKPLTTLLFMIIDHFISLDICPVNGDVPVARYCMFIG